MNKKRVQRLWREADLKAPKKEPAFAWCGENGCTRRRAEYPNYVWSYDFDDFAMDSTEDGRRLKVMPVVDEYTP